MHIQLVESLQIACGQLSHNYDQILYYTLHVARLFCEATDNAVLWKSPGRCGSMFNQYIAHKHCEAPGLTLSQTTTNIYVCWFPLHLRIFL